MRTTHEARAELKDAHEALNGGYGGDGDRKTLAALDPDGDGEPCEDSNLATPDLRSSGDIPEDCEPAIYYGGRGGGC
jgi:hypothetical protein